MNKIHSLKLSVLLLLTLSFSLVSCLKKDALAPNTGNLLEQYFETNVLNQNFIINFATNNGVDLTSNYNGYIFKLLKTDYYHGPLQVTKGSTVYTGTWSSNDDYSKLVIGLPSTPQEFIFITREWRFTKKQLPQLELAPWGNNDPVVLHMLRQ
ncbi:MAG: hypothetical protein M3004_02795 [Bacteroidota bacterium]|nr:hypothetical protein [Bacteroidota bacterium]